MSFSIVTSINDGRFLSPVPFIFHLVQHDKINDGSRAQALLAPPPSADKQKLLHFVYSHNYSILN